MDPDRIALVKTTWSNGKVRIGAAYLITERLLITARHVIAEFGLPERIDVRLGGANGPWTQVSVKWQPDGADASDLAVLELDTPRAGTAPVGLAALPCSNVPWEGGGFLADSSITADEVYEKKYEGLSGTLYQPLTGAEEVSASVEAPVNTAEAWAGISGSPVFVDKRLVACISNATKKFEGNRVKVVPILRLLPEGIRSQFALPGIQEQAVSEIASRLHANPDLCSALGYFFKESERTPRQIAEQLVKGLPPLEAFSRLHDVLYAKDGIRDYRAAKTTAKEIVEWLWPARSGDIPGTADESAKEGVVQAPPGSGRAYAEARMASIDEAPAELVVSPGSCEVHGRSALSLPPEPGLQLTNSVQHLQKELRALFPQHNVAVSGRPADLARDLNGLLRLQEMTRSRHPRRGRPPRGPHLVHEDYREPTGVRALIEEVKKLVPNLWVWQYEASKADPDFDAIMSALKFIIGAGDDSGETDAVVD